MSNIGVVVLAQQIKDRANAQAIAENWKMSNIEVKQLLWTVDHRDQVLFLSDVQTMVVNGVDRDWVCDLLRVREEYYMLEQIKVWEAPVFPINGNDLIAIGYKPGPGLGFELKRRKEWWIDSGFKMSREDLLSYL